MNLTPNPQLSTEILEYLTKKYIDTTRQKDIHLTDLTYCLTKAYFNRFNKVEPTRKEVLLFSLGLALQDVLVAKSQNAVTILKDGIVLSPDFLTVSGKLAELKTTRIRATDSFQVPEGWKKQMMGYCFASSTIRYELAVLHMSEPELKSWSVEFEQGELEDFWSWLLDRKEVLEEAILKQQIPTPFKYAEEYECRYCSYKLVCEALK